MDELKEQASYYESFLWGWVWVLLIGSIFLCFFDLDKLSCLALWGSLLALIIQKCIRIFDICFLMQKDDYLIRLFLLAINVAILGASSYVLYDLVSKFGGNVLGNLELNEVLLEAIDCVQKFLEYLKGVLFFLCQKIKYFSNVVVEFLLLRV